MKKQRQMQLEQLESRLLLDGSPLTLYPQYDVPSGSSESDQLILEADTLFDQASVPSMNFTNLVDYPNAINGIDINSVAINPNGDLIVAGDAGLYSGTVKPVGFDRIVNAHSGGSDGFVAKFDGETGEGEWITFIGGSSADSITRMDVDDNGLIWTFGDFDSDDFPDTGEQYANYFAAAFDSNGARQWVQALSYYVLDGNQTTYFAGNSEPSRMTVTPDGRAVGYMAISTDEAEFPDEYDIAGTLVINSNGSRSVENKYVYNDSFLGSYFSKTVAVSTNLYYALGSPSEYTGLAQYSIYTINGTSISEQVFDGIAQDIAVDSEGNVVVTGFDYGANPGDYSQRSVFVAKMSGGSSIQWRETLDSDGYDSSTSINVDGSNNIYISGVTYDPDTFPFLNEFVNTPDGESSAGYVASFSSQGQLNWASGLGEYSDDVHIGTLERCLAVSDSGEVMSATDDFVDKVFRLYKVGNEEAQLPEASLAGDLGNNGFTLTTDINGNGYIDIDYDHINTSTIDGDEFTISGIGSEGVTIASKPKAIDKGEGIYRYNFAGAFSNGPVTVEFEAGSFQAENGVGNTSSTVTFNAIPDIAPLVIDVSGDELEWNEDEERFEYEGDVDVAMKLESGGYSSVLMSIDGLIALDNDGLYGEGEVSTAITGSEYVLFDGEFGISPGTSTTYYLDDSTPNAAGLFEPAGLAMEMTNITLESDKVKLQGYIELPAEYGNAKLAVDSSHSIIMSASGVSVDGGTLTLPDVSIDLPYLEMTAESLSVEYIAATPASLGQAAKPDALRFRGKVTLPNVFNATADFTKDELTNTDGYIEVSSAGVSWNGKLSVSDIVIVPDMWEVKEASLEVRDVPNVGMNVVGEGTATVPPGMDIICGLGFLDGTLNYINLGVDNLDVPIGTTGAFLQRVSGNVTNLADPEWFNIAFGGGMGFTAGPELNISLPDWAGGDMDGSLAAFEVDGSINIDELSGTGSIEIIGGLAEGTGVSNLNWEKGTLSANCVVTALDNLLTINGSLKANSNMDITLTGTGQVGIPDIVPIWGGKQIAGGTSMLYYTNDDNSANDFIAGWGQVSVSVFGSQRTFTAGIRVNLDGSYSFLGAKDVGKTVQQAAAPAGMSPSYDVLFDSSSVSQATYAVEAGSEWTMFNVNWNSAVDAEIRLTDPNGTVYTEADIAASNSIAIVGELSEAGDVVVLVDNPAAGNWVLELVADSPVAAEFNGVQEAALPGVTIDDVSINPYTSNATVSYSSDASLSGYSLAFYYDDNNSGADGVFFADDEGDGSVKWDLSDVPAGTYYVYATIMDESNTPVSSYYVDSVIVEASLPVTQIQMGTGHASKVTYTDPDGTVVTVSAKCDSAILEFVGDDIAFSGTKTVVVTGGNLFLQEMIVDSVSDAALKLSAKGGADNIATIGDITSTTLKSLSSKGVNLVGDVTVDGSLGKMTLSDVNDNVTVAVSDALKGVSIKAGAIGENVNFEINDSLKSFSAVSYSSGEITSLDAKKITVKEGDFGVDVTILNGDLGGLKAGGDITGDIYAAGNIKSVATKAGNFSGTIIANEMISKISAMGFDGASVYAGSAGSFAAKEGIDMTLILTEGDLKGIKAAGDVDLIATVEGTLKSIKTKGNIGGVVRTGGDIGKVSGQSMIDCLLMTGGDIGSVSLKGDMTTSALIAGYDIGSDLTFNSTDVAGSGNIKSVKVSGTYSKSNLMAGCLAEVAITSGVTVVDVPYTTGLGTIGKVSFGSVAATDENLFGVFAGEEVKSVKVKDKSDLELDNFYVGSILSG